MKKNRIFLGVLFVTMLLIGSGYAAWAQSFTVSNVVNTGELSFNIQTQALKYGEYTELSILNDGESKLDINITDAYPRAEYTYDVLIKNTGTIKIEFNKIEEKYLKDDVTLTYDFENAMEIEPDASAIIPIKITAGDSIAEKSKIEFSQIVQYTQFNDENLVEPEKPVEKLNVEFKTTSPKDSYITLKIFDSNDDLKNFDQIALKNDGIFNLTFYNSYYESGDYRIHVRLHDGVFLDYTVNLNFEKGTSTIKSIEIVE